MPSYTSRRPARGGRYQSNTRSFSAPKRKGRGQYINPEKFVQAATAATDAPYDAKHTFADFAIDERLKANVAEKGFVNPSPIQDQTIAPALEGNDVIGIADTGTGKTAAFGLPLLHKLITDPIHNALIIAPTRELAQQIDDELRSLGKGTGLSGALLIGGVNIGPQIRDLRQNPQIIIGTPGRIKDHMERGTLMLGVFDFVVLDEVDRMLDMGFIHDIKVILNELPAKHQSMFFSATLDSKVRTLINQFSNDPVTVEVKSNASSANVHQNVVRFNGKEDKMSKLHDLLISEDVDKVILFDETQRSVERLSNELLARGFTADAIHGGKAQGQRQRALNRFKKNEVNILVATDVAARGIDVSDVTHVINFSIPQSYDDYIHRIGRAGRAGKIGNALTFVEK
jgi:ATP-dependent RNA helicase RhlE